MPREYRPKYQVPAPQPPRFRSQAKQPFQSVLPHPLRGLLQLPDIQIEGPSDPEHDCRQEHLSMLIHPALLLGAAESDPDAVGLLRVDVPPHSLIFLRRATPERPPLNTT